MIQFKKYIIFIPYAMYYLNHSIFGTMSQLVISLGLLLIPKKWEKQSGVTGGRAPLIWKKNSGYPHLWIGRSFPSSEVAIFTWKMPTVCWNEWEINIPIFIFWVMVDCVYNFRWRTLISQCVTDQKNMSSKVTKFTWEMRNVLKQMKNQFSDF